MMRQRAHSGHRVRTAQRARDGRVLDGHLDPEADQHQPRQSHDPLRRGEPRQQELAGAQHRRQRDRRRRWLPRGARLHAGVERLGRGRHDRHQDQTAGGDEPRRHADYRPGARGIHPQQHARQHRRCDGNARLRSGQHQQCWRHADAARPSGRPEAAHPQQSVGLRRLLGDAVPGRAEHASRSACRAISTPTTSTSWSIPRRTRP